MPVDEDQRAVIRAEVWSGFAGPDDLNGLIEDFLLDDPDADAEALRAAITAEFAAKAAAEASWPARTDCDRLDHAFSALDADGILALHDAGYTMSDGHSDAAEVLADAPAGRYRGYCFYHRQDIESVLDGGALHVAFDDLDGGGPQKPEIGRSVAAALKAAGLPAQWDGDPQMRIAIRPFAWQRRYAG